MRLTQQLWKQHLGWHMKNLWKIRTERREPRLIIAETLKDRKVIDPLQEWAPPPVTWHPPVADDPAFPDLSVEVNKDKLLADWNDDPTFIVTPGIKLIEGLKQVSVLCKCQIHEGLPPSVMERIPSHQLIDDQDLLVQRIILQSQKWDNVDLKLPRRTDPEMPWKYIFKREWGTPAERSRDIMIRGLLHLCDTLYPQYPSILRDRHVITQPFISANYIHKGDERVVIQGELNRLITSDTLLPPFANEELVDESVQYQLPDLWPIEATIDFKRDNLYTLKFCNGTSRGYEYDKVQTLFLDIPDDIKAEDAVCGGLMFCLAATLTQARRAHQDVPVVLKSPIPIQCICVTTTGFHSVFFQLNTLNLSSREGVKNIAWVDTDSNFYLRRLPQYWKKLPEFNVTQYHSYDNSVFNKFLAIYLNGLNKQTQVTIEQIQNTCAAV